MSEEIFTSKAPKPIGPYSQAIISGNLIFCSGQIGINPDTGELGEDIEAQTKQVLKNLKEILTEAHSSLEKVIKTTIFLKNIEDFKKVNEIYGEFFSSHKPARSTVEVSNLPKGALVEIEIIAER